MLIVFFFCVINLVRLIFVLGGCLLLIHIAGHFTFVSIKIPNGNCVPCSMWWLHFVWIPSIRPKEYYAIKLWLNISYTQTMGRIYSGKQQKHKIIEMCWSYTVDSVCLFLNMVNILIFNAFVLMTFSILFLFLSFVCVTWIEWSLADAQNTAINIFPLAHQRSNKHRPFAHKTMTINKQTNASISNLIEIKR